MQQANQIETLESLGQQRGYEPESLWRKLTRQARRAGREVVGYALQLHYAAHKPTTPTWARRTAYGALAYFILPLDAVPDFIAGIGYTDDLGALTLALTTLAAHIDDDVRADADAQLGRWFGPDESDPAQAQPRSQDA